MTSCHHRVCQPLVQLFLLLAGFRLVALADISITKQPQNTTLDAGQTLRLSVEYSGEIPTSVYWTRDNQTIAGASATNLVITNMTVNKGGIYRAHLVKHSVITESEPAVVLVNDMYWGPVGFVNLEVTPGLQLMTFPLRSTMTVAQLFHTLPAGVTLYKMDGNGYRANNYFNGWSDPDMIIVPGEAIFVHNANPHSMTLTTHGYLLLGQLTTRLPAGFSAFGTLVPRTGSIMEHYNLPPNSETTLYRFNKATQSFTTYAWPFDAPSWTLAMGEGLFAYSPYEQQLMTYFTIDFGFGSSYYTVVLPPLRTNSPQFYFSTFGISDASGRILEIDGSRPVKGIYSTQIYLGLANEEATLQPVGKPVRTLDRTYNGRVQGKLVDVPGRSGGDTVYAQLRVWESSYGSTYQQAVQNGGRHGKSAITSYTLRSAIQNNQPSLPPLPFDSFPSFAVQLGNDKTTRVTDIAKAAEGARLWFIAEAGKNFRIQYKDSFLAPSWITLPGAENLPGNNGEVTFLDTTANPHRFYRIQLLP